MKKAGLILMLLSLFACSRIVETPENLVSEQKMVAILAEIYTYQQSSYLSEISSENQDFAKIDASILSKYETHPKDFEESYKYYYLQPELFKEILLEVRNQLESQLTDEERKKREEDRESKEKK